MDAGPSHSRLICVREFRVLDGLCIAFFWAAQYPIMLVFFVTIVTQED